MIERLSKGRVDRISKEAMKAAMAGVCKAALYPDGQGLYLQITDRGTASWISQYKFRKKRRKMGHGPTWLVDLDAARAKNAEVQRLLRVEGVDPLTLRARRRRPRPSRKPPAPISPTTRPGGRTRSTSRNTT
jgi:hypothetical protein